MIGYNKTNVISIIALGLLGASVFVLYKKDDQSKAEYSDGYVISHTIENALKLKHISASVILDNGARFENQIDKVMIGQSGIVSFHNNINKMPASYIVTYRIEKEGLDITDIILSISHSKVKATVENVLPDSKVSFKQDQKILNDNVPVDWSGKLELLSVAKVSGNICIEIVNKNEIQNICHSVKKERQVA